MESAFFAGLAGSFGLRLSERESQDFGITLSALSIMDNVLDSSKDASEGRALYQEHLDAIAAHELETTDELLGRYAVRFASWHPDRQYDQLKHFAAIGDLGVEKRAIDDVGELFDLVVREARHVGAMLLIEHAERGTDDFDRFLDKLVICAMITDTLCDLKADFQGGLTRVRPSIKNRAYLAARMTPLAVEVLASIDLDVSKQIGKAARLGVINHRI